MHSKTVYALAAGSFREGWKVRPNDIMHWKVMEWAYQNGYSKYHMGFVSEPLPTEGTNSWGIWRWKREWGGDLKRLQIFQKFFMPKYKFVLKVKGFVGRT
jgi:lipid II:glycine glycyltransferase (peptidoglycan interpeptide bridge formation enzyme)